MVFGNLLKTNILSMQNKEIKGLYKFLNGLKYSNKNFCRKLGRHTDYQKEPETDLQIGKQYITSMLKN